MVMSFHIAKAMHFFMAKNAVFAVVHCCMCEASWVRISMKVPLDIHVPLLVVPVGQDDLLPAVTAHLSGPETPLHGLEPHQHLPSQCADLWTKNFWWGSCCPEWRVGHSHGLPIVWQWALPCKYCFLAFGVNKTSHGSHQSLPVSPYLLNHSYKFTILGQLCPQDSNHIWISIVAGGIGSCRSQSMVAAEIQQMNRQVVRARVMQWITPKSLLQKFGYPQFEHPVGALFGFGSQRTYRHMTNVNVGHTGMRERHG